MSREDDSDAETAALRERLHRLNEASVHLAEGLDFDRVLQVVADSACELTGAQFGGISVVDERGDLEAFVTSGLTDEERQGLYDLPHGEAYFEHLSGLGEPLRVDHLGTYFASMGLGEFRPPADLGAALFVPIMSRGEIVGNIHLSNGRTRPAFSDEDEETLAMFATQAALAIANARRYRHEQRARADLQTLLDTAPVGVFVFDAGLGVMTMANREALRITDEVSDAHGEMLAIPDDLVIRRADGREVSLAEQPLGPLLRASETVRAERIVLSRPEGASKPVLVHATPIMGEDGDVATVIATVQDMTALEDLDRLRADILGLARDELRSPLLSVKGAAAMLLASGGTLDPAESIQLAHIVDAQADYMRDLIGELSDLAQIHTGTLPLNPAPTHIARLTADATADLPEDASRCVTVEVDPHLGLVTADQRQAARVLRSILADAVRTAQASMPVRVAADRDGPHARVSVTFRRAAPAEQFSEILQRRPDSPTDEHRDPSRRPALSLAICKGIIEAHGGRIWADSAPNGETHIAFTLPLVQSAATETAAGPQTPVRGAAARILAVDIDPLTQRHMNDALIAAGFELAFARDAEQALSASASDEPDLVLAGLAHSTAVDAEIERAMSIAVGAPVVFVIDHGVDDAALRAIKSGASDYLVRPFPPTELLARVQAALYRSASPQYPSSPPFVLGGLTVDYADRTVTVKGRLAQLTETEYRLLCELTANPERTMSADQLMRRIWKKPVADPAGPVRSVVKRLRRKLGDDARNPSYIITVPRQGYRIATPQQAALSR